MTLLLRVRGNTEVERAALSAGAQFDRYVAGLVGRPRRDGDIRPDVDPAVTARLLFGMVNSLIEWYRPGATPDRPGRRRVPGGLRRPPGRLSDVTARR